MCGVCVGASFIGGWVGGMIGIKVPNHKNALLVSKIITSSLLVLTTIAVKILFNLSVCQGNSLNLKTVVILAGVNLPMGILYSIGVNYLLGRFIYKPICPRSGTSPCCCANSSKPARI